MLTSRVLPLEALGMNPRSMLGKCSLLRESQLIITSAWTWTASMNLDAQPAVRNYSPCSCHIDILLCLFSYKRYYLKFECRALSCVMAFSSYFGLVPSPPPMLSPSSPPPQSVCSLSFPSQSGLLLSHHRHSISPPISLFP